MKKKAMALVLALGLVTVGIAGGTMAWLTASSTEVKNTFTDSDINITLTESVDTDSDGEASFKMIPGWTIAKDPKVTVAKGSEDCYVFVKIDKSSAYDTYMENYAVDSSVWSALKDNNDAEVLGVYYCKVTDVDAENWSSYVLAGAHKDDCAKDASCACENANGFVTVRHTVTKKQMNDLKTVGATQPTLTFTAYASQLMKNNTEEFTPYVAWTNVYGSSSNS